MADLRPTGMQRAASTSLGELLDGSAMQAAWMLNPEDPRLLRSLDQVLWFPRIHNVEDQKSSQRFHIALDDEDFFLLQLHLQPFFERRQAPACFLYVGHQHAIDDNGITIGNARHVSGCCVGQPAQEPAQSGSFKQMTESM